MDRHLFDKLAFLEGDERVRGYSFFTNFTIPKASHIEAIHQFKKMGSLAISIYGHDLASFKAITKSTDVAYFRLLRNLELLLRMMATGIVNGCACRDTDATLRLGDLHEMPLKEIISTRNPAYMALIDEQQNGIFRPVCRSCDFYKSIYYKSRSYAGTQLQTLEQFKASAP